jgi:hypothetical protein
MSIVANHISAKADLFDLTTNAMHPSSHDTDAMNPSPHDTDAMHPQSQKTDTVTPPTTSPASELNRLVIRKLQRALEADPEVDLASKIPSSYATRLAERKAEGLGFAPVRFSSRSKSNALQLLVRRRHLQSL